MLTFATVLYFSIISKISRPSLTVSQPLHAEATGLQFCHFAAAAVTSLLPGLEATLLQVLSRANPALAKPSLLPLFAASWQRPSWFASPVPPHSLFTNTVHEWFLYSLQPWQGRTRCCEQYPMSPWPHPHPVSSPPVATAPRQPPQFLLAVALPDEYDNWGRLRHGPDHAANAHHAEECQEGLFAAGTGAFSGNNGGIFGRDRAEAWAAAEVLWRSTGVQGKQELWSPAPALCDEGCQQPLGRLSWSIKSLLSAYLRGAWKGFPSMSALMHVTSKETSLGLFLFSCPFQVSPINVMATELLPSYAPSEENKETICVPQTQKIPQLWV